MGCNCKNKALGEAATLATEAQPGISYLERPITRPLDYTTRAWPYAEPLFAAKEIGPWLNAANMPRFEQRPVAIGRHAGYGPPFEVRPGPLPRQYLGIRRRHSMNHPGIGSLGAEKISAYPSCADANRFTSGPKGSYDCFDLTKSPSAMVKIPCPVAGASIAGAGKPCPAGTTFLSDRCNFGGGCYDQNGKLVQDTPTTPSTPGSDAPKSGTSYVPLIAIGVGALALLWMLKR